MEPNQQLRALWGYKWWIAIFAVAAAVAAYLVSQTLTKTYEASASVQVVSGQQKAGNFLDDQALQSLTNIYAELAKTTRVAQIASRKPGIHASPKTIQDDVSVTSQEQPGVLNITGKSTDPKLASAYANAYTAAFIDFVGLRNAGQRRAAVKGIQDRINAIQAKIAAGGFKEGDPQLSALNSELQALQTKAADTYASAGDSVEIIEPASVPDSPASPQPTRNALLAFVAALALGLGFAYVRANFRDRYRSVEEAASDLGLPILAELPRAEPDTQPAVEAFRGLRTSVAFALTRGDRARANGTGDVDAGNDGRGSTVLVTSPETGSGKSYTAANLARALAADGERVVAVDGDLRRPTLHEHLVVPLESGLGDLLSTEGSGHVEVLAKTAPLQPAGQIRGGDLRVVTAGRSLVDSVERLSSDRMAETMSAFRQVYDYVIVDTPPALAIVDAVVLSRYAQGVVVVIDSHRTRRRNARRALQTLNAIGVPVLGLVYNSHKHDVAASASGYYVSGRQDVLAPGTEVRS